MTLFSQRSVGRQKLFGYIKPQRPYSYNERNKVLLRKSVISVKICLPSTRTAYSEMCPIKEPSQLKQPHSSLAERRRGLHFERL
jgi:hypothetical protein